MIMNDTKICIQVHDYDNTGRYRITQDGHATPEEIQKLKERARDSVILDWTQLPDDAAHVVYYAELIDKQNKVAFVGIYMRGEAFNERDFERIFHRSEIGYVGAFHKR